MRRKEVIRIGDIEISIEDWEQMKPEQRDWWTRYSQELEYERAEEKRRKYLRKHGY